MAKLFGQTEHRILSLFQNGAVFLYNGQQFEVIMAGKPTCYAGEPKTDIYVLAQNNLMQRIEIKISFKQANAEFLENKISADRAEQLLGDDWQYIISTSTRNIAPNFECRNLIFHQQYGRTQAGSITLGWKFEFVNVINGELSGRLNLSFDQLLDVYSGSNLSAEKRNASVNGRIIRDSGVANCVLFDNYSLNSAQDVIDALISVEEYVQRNPNIYYACKALNYRSLDDKFDGNRPLAVWVHWFERDGRLAYEIQFNEPLITGGNHAAACLKQALRRLGVRSALDLGRNNVEDPSIIYY